MVVVVIPGAEALVGPPLGPPTGVVPLFPPPLVPPPTPVVPAFVPPPTAPPAPWKLGPALLPLVVVPVGTERPPPAAGAPGGADCALVGTGTVEPQETVTKPRAKTATPTAPALPGFGLPLIRSSSIR